MDAAGEAVVLSQLPREGEPATLEHASAVALASHGLSGAAIAAADDGLVVMADEVRALLRGRHLGDLALAMHVQQLGERCAASLDAAGIPSIVVKGPSIAVHHPRPQSRTYSDVDLLVPPAMFDAAIETVQRTDGLHPPPTRRLPVRLLREGLNLRDDTGSIDLHQVIPPWVWGERLSFDRLHADATVQPSGLRYASREHNLLIAALHVLSDKSRPGHSLSAWRDVAALARGVDTSVASEEARSVDLAWLLAAVLDELPPDRLRQQLLDALGDDRPRRSDVVRLRLLLPPAVTARHELSRVFRLPPVNAICTVVDEVVPPRSAFAPDVRWPYLRWWMSGARALRQGSPRRSSAASQPHAGDPAVSRRRRFVRAPRLLSGRPMYVTWAAGSGRVRDLAAATDGIATHIYDERLVSPELVPLRYVMSSVRTSWALLRHRPGAVVVTLPPPFPALVALAYCRLTRTVLVLDSNPASFGLKQNRMSQALLPVHRWLARRAAAVLVTTDDLADIVRTWGAEPLILHEPAPALPPSRRLRPPAAGSGDFVALFVCVFGADEPVPEVLEAARRLPDVRFRITGDPRKAQDGLLDDVPPNVDLVGYLEPARYGEELADADVVLSLTTEPTSVTRSGYEAVYARKPLIVTDWPASRAYFRHAQHVPNDAAHIAEAVTQIRDAYGQFQRASVDAHREQELRAEAQIAQLQTLLRRRGR
jgi:glycosyltransferase involved in cell wall biosynthesis